MPRMPQGHCWLPRQHWEVGTQETRGLGRVGLEQGTPWPH